VRGHGHRLHAADERRPRLAQEDHVRAGDDRLDAAAAEAVDGERGPVVRHARLERDVARAVDGVARGLKRVADDGVVNLLRRHARVFERAARGRRPEVNRLHVLERPDVTGHRRALAAQNEDVLSHDFLPVPLSQESDP
jgi:hypothetical protein